MNSPIGPNEIRVVIRPVEARDYDLGPIPAELFKKTFDAFLTALQVTDRELQPKARSSEFLVSQLALNPYEFGILEKRKALGQHTPSAIEFFRRCAEGIYRSDYQAVVRHPRVTRAFIRIVKALNPSFHVLAQFNDIRVADRRFFSPPGRSGRGQGRWNDQDRQLVSRQRDHVVRGAARRDRLPRRRLDRRPDAASGNNSCRVRIRQVTRRRCAEPFRQ